MKEKLYIAITMWVILFVVYLILTAIIGVGFSLKIPFVLAGVMTGLTFLWNAVMENDRTL